MEGLGLDMLKFQVFFCCSGVVVSFGCGLPDRVDPCSAVSATLQPTKPCFVAYKTPLRGSESLHRLAKRAQR